MNGSLIGQQTQPIRQNGFAEQQIALLANRNTLVNGPEQLLSVKESRFDHQQ